MVYQFYLLFIVILVSGCRSSILNDATSDELGSEYIPSGWEKVKSGEQGSIEAFRAAIASKDGLELSNGRPEITGDDGSVAQPPLSTGPSTIPGPIEAQYALAIKTSKRETINLKIGAKVPIGGANKQYSFAFNKESAVRSWIYGDNARAPLWQRSKQFPEGYISLKNRTWASYQCGVVVTISSEDQDSIEANLGLDLDIAGLFTVSGSGTNTTANTTNIENVFGRLDKTVVIKASDLPKGSTIGPSNAEIQKKCAEFYKDPTIQEAINTDIAERTSQWQYVNPNSVCLEDPECEEWHQEILGLVQYWTVPRCVKVAKSKTKETFYACRLRSKKGGNCTLPGNPRGPFEYRCDKGLTCSPLSKGALWWKQTYGECQ